jgi:lactate permease
MNENNLLSVLFAISPVIVIFFLLVIRRTPADIAGLIGWLVTILITWLYFKTSLIVIILSSLGGFIASLPIALVVAYRFSVTVMQEGRSDCTNCLID